jgi:organic hydroperoxide reductase OsmC/OhrA
MKGAHHYNATIKWTGNKGSGTSGYRDYERSHSILLTDKPEILASSDPAFRGDKTKHNPEDLLLASLSSCHMLWYLHLCAEADIVIVDYVDNAIGTMLETADGSGYFSHVTLQPFVTVSDATMMKKANELHEKANEMCFIANSVNFPVHHKPICEVSR